MKKLFVLVLVLSLGLVFNSCTHKDKEGEVKKEQKTEKTLWTCPMHPQIKKEAPGSCPICAMTLVPVQTEKTSLDEHKAESSDHAPFELSSYRRQLIGVKSLVVGKKHLVHTINAPGKVAFDPELYAAQGEYFVALRQFEELSKSPLADVKRSAKQMLDSAKIRLKVLGLSDDQLQMLNKRKDEGAQSLLPQKGENLLVYAEVFEMDLRSIAPGQDVKVSGESLEGKTLRGKVMSVDRMINPNTRTAKVRIEIPEAKTLLRSESYVDVEILTPMGEELAVPTDAILDTGKEAYVYVVKEDGSGQGKFEPRKVQVKFHADEESAIASGLTEGERIVTSSNFLIDSESRLKGVLQAAQQADGAEAKKPVCPPGEEWHDAMKHCMKKVE